MKLLIIGVLLVASGVCGPDATSEATTIVTSEASSGATSGAPGSTVSGATSQAPGSTVSGASSAAPGSTVSGASPASTQAAPTTAAKLEFTTLPIKNAVQPEDAKLILQHAYQLNQQIAQLNDYLLQAQKDTDPDNSPLFAQLQAFSANITAQNDTLQGYIGQLQGLQTAQTSIDSQLNAALDTFTCFSQSSCVTDVPTTPEPTSPGPTPPVVSCTNFTLTAKLGDSQPYNFDSQQNVALCTISVKASTVTNYVSLTIDTKFGGNLNGYVQLVETRTKRTVSVNTTQTGTTFNAFQQIDVYYFADPRSTVQFNFTYVEVDSCTLNCNQATGNGVCKTSPSGVQYCECKKCLFQGDHCEEPLANPCLSKQNRACKQTQGFGQCYVNPCYDQCWACNCAPNAYNPDSPLSCLAPEGQTPAPIAPTLPPSEVVCPSTAAPTTTAALFTSTVSVLTSGNPASTVTGGASTVNGGSTGAVVTTNAPPSTVGGSTEAGASTSSAPSAPSSTITKPGPGSGEE